MTNKEKLVINEMLKEYNTLKQLKDENAIFQDERIRLTTLEKYLKMFNVI